MDITTNMATLLRQLNAEFRDVSVDFNEYFAPNSLACSTYLSPFYLVLDHQIGPDIIFWSSHL